ncbi:HAMP domain-containing histidine kinase [Niastella caeni]|uniref:HAMP domain-containing histidine kinase n=1 Tax=Niastella caeni TaxID=2569763 RepID=A0A4S8HS00_9BACT|nr:HAMP domain-containing histidine kinase [Niastella caeni]THU38230.1 HAMP domain-containing histidine kinase [Niastella caeni]
MFLYRSYILDNTGVIIPLNISAAIIRQHMGTIGVESLPGNGTTFYFTLPP